jgi:hypothetical protein
MSTPETMRAVRIQRHEEHVDLWSFRERLGVGVQHELDLTLADPSIVIGDSGAQLVLDVTTPDSTSERVVFADLGWFAVVEMAIFIVILGTGLLYAWRKGVLRWA